MTIIKWEHFSHGADVGIRGMGSTLAEAFAMAAKALTCVVTEPDKIQPAIAITINCKAPDAEILFIDWLNAIIFQMDARQMLFSEFQVHITPAMHLTAVIKGEKINRLKHQPAVDVKGATYNELHVVKKKKQWIAQCVVDV